MRNGWPPEPKAVLLILWAISGWIALPIAIVYTSFIYGAGAMLCK